MRPVTARAATRPSEDQVTCPVNDFDTHTCIRQTCAVSRIWEMLALKSNNEISSCTRRGGRGVGGWGKSGEATRAVCACVCVQRRS